METFIKIYKVDKSICDDLINYFKQNNEYKQKGMIENLNKTEINTSIKESTDVSFFNHSNNITIKKFFNILNECYNDYIKYYSLNERLWTSIINNIQHYKPKEGFKIWHYENSHLNTCKRKLVYMLYLNNVKNGGTEWKYQKFKTKAIKGNLIIWPASFTHTHRGIISDINEKYIATGWFENI